MSVAIPPPERVASICNANSAKCGLGELFGALDGLRDKLQDVLGDAVGSTNGVFDSISSLKSSMTSALSDVAGQLKAVLGDVGIPDFNLPNLQSELLGTLRAGLTDVTGMASKIANLRIEYPGVDFDSLLKKMQSAAFDFCRDVPNFVKIDGVAVEKPTPAVRATNEPKELRSSPDVPTASRAAQTLNSATPAAVAVLRRVVKISADTIHEQTSVLQSSTTMIVPTTEQVAAGRGAGIAEIVKKTTNMLFASKTAVNAQAAAASDTVVRATAEFNTLTATVGAQIDTQIHAAFTEEKVKNMFDGLKPATERLQLVGQHLASTTASIESNLAKWSGSDEATAAARSDRSAAADR